MLKTLGIIVLNTVLLLGTVIIISRFAGIDIGLERVFRGEFVASQEPIGLWEDDPVLGWKNKPGTVGRHTTEEFDVTYTTDPEGHRVTPGSYHSPVMLFLGGSFTFGHGVEDRSTFTHFLSEMWPRYKIANSGVNAWGTGQSLLHLEQFLAENTPPALVVYGAISHHVERNYLRDAWLKLMDASKRKVPYFDIENGLVVSQGFASLEQALPDSESLREKEMEIALALVSSIHQLCLQSGIPFVIALLPDDEETNFGDLLLRKFGDQIVLDLRKEINYSDIRYPRDSHPNTEGHALIAAGIDKKLESLFER